ncbi:hypothetical protein [Rhizobium populisoli]|uniref:hypothetical protein n=1 Tax=Rhizobium populisoli TaxID=2859785 RepID=UPI001FEA886B|nr:hypothetical protein [Rhizobium populisoli]
MTDPTSIDIEDDTSELDLLPIPVLQPNPSRLRLAMLLVIAVYPLITTLLYILTPLTDGWAVWHRTLLIAPIMVGSIVFLVSPTIQKHFGWYVARLPRPVRREG